LDESIKRSNQLDLKHSVTIKEWVTDTNKKMKSRQARPNSVFGFTAQNKLMQTRTFFPYFHYFLIFQLQPKDKSLEKPQKECLTQKNEIPRIQIYSAPLSVLKS
jgi:hypothetical protein